MTSRYRCDALTNWAMKPLMLAAGQLYMCSYVSMKEMNVIDVWNISFKTARIILHLISFPQFLFELFHIVTSITRTRNSENPFARLLMCHQNFILPKLGVGYGLLFPGWLLILLNIFYNRVLLRCYWGGMKSRRVTVIIKRAMVCVKRVRNDCKQRLELNSRRKSIRT